MTNPLNTLHEPEDNNLEQLNALLNRYCLSLTQSVWDSEDLVQDTWLKSLEKIKDQQHNNPQALLLRTAKNAWIDQIRRRKVFERILDKEREQAKEDGDAVMDSSTLNMEMAFHFLMKHLSPLQRTVLLMRSVLGYSVAETAEKLQSTEGAVKAAYHRARKELQAVEHDIEDEIVVPQEEEARIRLNAIATAYVNGEVDEVLRLVQGDQEVLIVVGAYSTSVQSQFEYPSYYFEARMVA
ncbi:RNA polymerase sigma factor [Paenibacillus sp. N3/727]|uniref:RNA polymerase sigma factor n=1 Tax=Paenibacillus sp. N3/727 TaxID=2925845 RepID=UPI001F5303E9|nr:RNA polymerase sigma factor [Paenibacillus sp. N3/727]UNK16886.1 RNA polymerase sigma factor [Paenibacillus sp. N3/727]